MKRDKKQKRKAKLKTKQEKQRAYQPTDNLVRISYQKIVKAFPETEERKRYIEALLRI